MEKRIVKVIKATWIAMFMVIAIPALTRCSVADGTGTTSVPVTWQSGSGEVRVYCADNNNFYENVLGKWQKCSTSLRVLNDGTINFVATDANGNLFRIYNLFIGDYKASAADSGYSLSAEDSAILLSTLKSGATTVYVNNYTSATKNENYRVHTFVLKCPQLTE